MKTIIYSCKYPQIVPYFAKLFNKYFCETECIVLSHQNLPELPSNFSHFKLSQYTRSWVNDISEFFDTFKDEMFFSCMEDHFLYRDVNLDILDLAATYMDDNPNIYKFGCRIGPIHQIPLWALDTPGIQFTPYDSVFTMPCPVKQSLMPSIWRTSFFKMLLEHSKDYTAWEFELRPKTNTPYELEPEIREKIKDKTFLFYQEPEPFPCIDLVRGGNDNEQEWRNYVNPENSDIFYQARGAIKWN